MRRFAAVALLAAGFALPGLAQRTASHGGFSGSRGGFSGRGAVMSAPVNRGGYVPSSRFGYAGSTGGRVAMSASLYRGNSAAYNRRPGNPYQERYRGSRYAGYGVGIPYVGSAWVTPYELGYPDTAVDQGPGPYVAQDAGQPLEQPQAQVQVAPYPAYVEPLQQPVAAPEPEDAVTLVFKDGRPAEQIHNYILTRTTLYVRDQRKRDIPVADLDLEATAKANRDAGVTFELPASK